MARKRKLKEVHKLHKHRFIHYSSSEIVALAIDLFLLWVFVDFFNIHYLVAAAVAYLLAISIHYHTLRKHVFHGNVRDPFHTYAYFLGVGIMGFALTLTLLSFVVNSIHINYILARTFSALAVIPATYTLNTILTFLMPKPLPKEQDLYCNIPNTTYGQ